MVWPPQCIEGNKVYGSLAGSLIVKMAGSGLGEACQKAHRDPLAHGEGLRLSTELFYWELGPCDGFLARGSNED